MALNVKRYHAIKKHLGSTLGQDICDTVNAVEDRDVAKMLGDERPSVLWQKTLQAQTSR